MFYKSLLTINAIVVFTLLIVVNSANAHNKTTPNIRGGLIKVCFNNSHGLTTLGPV